MLHHLLPHLLRKSTMFKHASEENIARIASRMRRVDLIKGEVLYYQGDPTVEMFIITRGAVTRTRREEREHEHENLGSKGSEATIGALHLLKNEPYYATVRCTQDVVCFALSSIELRELLKESHSLATEVRDAAATRAWTADPPDTLWLLPNATRPSNASLPNPLQVIHSLAKDVLAQQVVLRTALLSQRAPEEQANAPLATALYTSIGASLEAFYRSALNARLNATLTGQV